MTPKDCEMLAAAIQRAMRNEAGVPVTDAALPIADLARDIADEFATAVPRFERDVFLRSCGVGAR